MLGTSFDAWGGIASVVSAYREDGLFQRLPMLYLATHCNGSAVQKMRCFARAWLTYVAMLLRGRVALAHLHAAGDASFWRKALFIVPAWLFRVPTVLHLHAGGFPDFYARRCNALSRLAVRYLCDHVDCVIVVSSVLKRWIETISRNTRVITIYNPVALAPLADARLREQAQLLFLGRLGAGKGSDDLLHALHRIVARHPEVRLLLAGDGDVERSRALAGQLGLDANVALLGWVGGEQKAHLLARAALYVLPSHAEGLPMSVLEAMSSGLAVLATPVGGIPEAVSDGVEGCLVPAGDIGALSVALERLLSDAPLRRRMGAAGRAKVEAVFACRRVIPLIEGLYRQLGALGPIDTTGGGKNEHLV